MTLPEYSAKNFNLGGFLKKLMYIWQENL